jgi:hypothetical protein
MRMGGRRPGKQQQKSREQAGRGWFGDRSHGPPGLVIWLPE